MILYQMVVGALIGIIAFNILRIVWHFFSESKMWIKFLNLLDDMWQDYVGEEE